MSPQKVDELFWELGANTVPLVGGVAKAQRSIAGLAKNVVSIKGALVGIGVVGALAFLKASSAAAKLDVPLREVSTLLPQTVEQMGELREEIIALSTRVPQPPEQLTKGLYQVISAGVTDTAEAMDLLEVAATAATAGLATSQDAVLAITTVLNAYQLEASEAARISDIFFATIAQGVITFPEIASSIGDMATTAAQAGVSVEEMTAALAAMTKAGISASEATTSLNRLFLAIVEGDLGSEFDLSAVAADGFAETMNKLEEATRGDVQALKSVVTDIRSFRAAAVIAGNQNAEFNRILSETSTAAGASKIAFDKMNGSLQAQSELLKNRVNAFFLELGVVTLPIVIAAVRALNQVFSFGAQEAESMAGRFAGLSTGELEGRLNRVQSQIESTRAEIARLETAPRAPGTQRDVSLEIVRQTAELEDFLRVEKEITAERDRRAPLTPEDVVPGGGVISDEIQGLRDQLATQLQDELVAITATAVDDMELEFVRLRDTIIKAFDEVPDEWKVVLEDMRADIEAAGIAEEMDVVLNKLASDLARFQRITGRGVTKPIEDLKVDVDDLADSVLFVARTFAELGQGFGLFGRDAASAINSIATVVEGVKGLSAAITGGTGIAGPIGGIAGGLASLGGLIFGGESERSRILKENNAALDRLTKAMEASALKAGVSGGLVGAGISAIGGATPFVDVPALAGQGRARFEAEITASLTAAGFTMEQLRDLAEEWGITLDGTTQSWEIFVDALQEVQAANLFEGFAGGMRRMRLEWELTDTIDPVKRLKDAREAFKELTDGIEAPKNSAEVIALFDAISRGDLTGIGKLSPNEALELLQLIEGLLDEAGTARGTTTSFAVNRSITEVTGNRLAGLLTTDVFWNEQTALNTAGILDALGGSRGGGLTPPSAVSVLGNTDVTIMINGAGDPSATAIAVRDELMENLDRMMGERLRDTRRSRGRQQTEAFRA